MMVLAKRNFKELIREPLNLVFLIGLPAILLIIFQQFKIPNDAYKIENFAPSMSIFSFGFISLFSGLLIAKDRASSFLSRLYASPLKSYHYILGYSIAFIPVSLIQSIVFYLCAMFLGLSFNINVLISILVLVLISFMFIGLGILIGSIFSDNVVPGITSLIINLIGFMSGMWFDIGMAGKFFEIVCRILPFSYAVDLARGCLVGNYDQMISLLVVLGYIVIIYLFAIIFFWKKMVSDNK